MHLFDVGLREKETDFKQELTDEKGVSDDEWEYFDKTFKQQRIMIEAKRKKLPRFAGRFKPVSNKFIIQTIQQTQSTAEANGDSMFIFPNVCFTKHI